MSKPQAYQVSTTDDKLIFQFYSESAEKRIKKVVLYQKYSDFPLIFEMLMGDMLDDNETIDFLIESNNGDRDEVLFTVFQTISAVLDEYSGSKILFYGSTAARTRLYQIIITKYFEQAQEVYLIKGIKNKMEENFVKDTNYDAFLISLHE
ncbi:MAG: DUF6934 family protein [Emticicia sp.]